MLVANPLKQRVLEEPLNEWRCNESRLKSAGIFRSVQGLAVRRPCPKHVDGSQVREFRTHKPLRALFVDPHLPEWLPEITLSNLHVGQAVVSIRFYREQDGSSSYEVLDQRGPLHIVRQPSPWSMTTGPLERVVDALASLLPGK